MYTVPESEQCHLALLCQTRRLPSAPPCFWFKPAKHLHFKHLHFYSPYAWDEAYLGLDTIQKVKMLDLLVHTSVDACKW